ncbi:hypothetical protein [Siminovitchia sp. 179-K 8D1 HS]|uniref:hypothetical protein n=1 Tax=Siminovitchia sp. 179-K 8D1 HS TaxID=3142385 RepID=UPI0039A0F399
MEKKNYYKPAKKAPKEGLEPSPTGYGFMSVTENEGEKKRKDDEENESLYGMEKGTSLESADFPVTDNPYFSDQEGV